MIPGSNILGAAFRVIAKQQFAYYRFASRTPNEVGQDVTLYQEPIASQGSVQPVPRSLYANEGLDFQKKYYNVFIEKGIIDVDRDVSGDQFRFKGLTLQCESKTPWCAIDGWDQVLCTEVPTNRSVVNAG